LCSRRGRHDMNMTKDERAKVKAKALRDYRRKEPLKVIAIRYAVSSATISLWAAQAKLKRRQQGCRKKTEPDERDIDIVQAVRAIRGGRPTLAEIGHPWPTRSSHHMSRANVHRIFQRWKNWVPEIPFVKGDKVRYIRRDYEVLEARAFDGDVRNLKTGVISTIPWKQEGHITVKLNVETTEPVQSNGNSNGHVIAA